MVTNAIVQTGFTVFFEILIFNASWIQSRSDACHFSHHDACVLRVQRRHEDPSASIIEYNKLYVTKSDFLIDYVWLVPVSILPFFITSSRAMWVADPSLHDHLHRVEVISLYFEIRYPAIPLGGFYVTVPEKILDGAQIGIRIEQLRGHRVPEMMAGNSEVRLTGVIFHTLLDAANGDGVPGTGPLFDQKNPGGFGSRPHFEISRQSEERIIAHIDDPVLAPFSIFDDDFLLFEVQYTQGEMSDFLHTQATPEHQHEHGPIPMPLHNIKEDIHLLIPQVPGKGLGHLEDVTPPNGIHDG